MNKSLSTIILLSVFLLGSFSMYAFIRYQEIYGFPTEVDVQIRTFAISYAALRNYTEKDNDEADKLMYKFMNTSIKKLNDLYPNASDNAKEMIYISYKGYIDYIQTNSKYVQPDKEINDIVRSVIKKYNKALKRDSAKSAEPLS